MASTATAAFDDTPLSKEELDEFERMALASAQGAQQEREAQWRAESRVFSWVDPEPVWVSAAEWNWSGRWGWPPEPTEPCDRIFRFSLIGGGQVKVTERWRLYRDTFRDGRDHLWANPVDLVVQAHSEDKLHRFAGRLDHSVCYEMQAKAVLFSRTARQAAVDRVAATLRAIDTLPDNFHALLDGTGGCAFCRRPLRDEISKLVGVGPDCARRYGIPYNSAAADKRLKLRRALLGESPIDTGEAAQ